MNEYFCMYTESAGHYRYVTLNSKQLRIPCYNAKEAFIFFKDLMACDSSTSLPVGQFHLFMVRNADPHKWSDTQSWDGKVDYPLNSRG